MHVGDKRKECSVLVGNPKKGALARPRCRWDDINKIDPTVLDWIQWRNGDEPVGSTK
jgi:hypothetical protein